MEETKEEKLQRFANIWRKSRAEAGKSQEYMAAEMNVTRKTIANWEAGISSPTFFQSGEWFSILGLNPVHYYLEYLYPSNFSHLKPGSEDAIIEEAIMGLVKECTITEKRQLLYLMAGAHGSSWFSLLQLFTAHCHTSMQSRVAAAQIILSNYEIEASANLLVCPEHIQPDVQMLRSAVEKGKIAALQQQAGYTIE